MKITVVIIAYQKMDCHDYELWTKQCYPNLKVAKNVVKEHIVGEWLPAIDDLGHVPNCVEAHLKRDNPFNCGGRAAIIRLKEIPLEH